MSEREIAFSDEEDLLSSPERLSESFLPLERSLLSQLIAVEFEFDFAWRSIGRLEFAFLVLAVLLLLNDLVLGGVGAVLGSLFRSQLLFLEVLFLLLT